MAIRRDYRRRWNNELADLVIAEIRAQIPLIRFGRLRGSIRKIVTTEQTTIYSTYFWFRFLDQGRGPVRAQPGGPPLIYFKDPREDPRIQGDYPRRRKNIRRLTKQQYEAAQEDDQLIVTREVGPVKARRWVEKGLRAARPKLEARLRERLAGEVRRLITLRTDSITVNL